MSGPFFFLEKISPDKISPVLTTKILHSFCRTLDDDDSSENACPFTVFYERLACAGRKDDVRIQMWSVYNRGVRRIFKHCATVAFSTLSFHFPRDSVSSVMDFFPPQHSG